MEGRIIWKESEIVGIPEQPSKAIQPSKEPDALSSSIPSAMPRISERKIKIALSVDVDAISGWLGTGAHPDNKYTPSTL